MSFSTLIGRLRIIGLLEGTSYLLLLGIAMPLKYMMGFPQAVQVIGMAHGILFILFIALTVQSTIIFRWSVKKLLILWIASILPFGTILADYKMLRYEPNSNA
jgi:integral membrane protein